MTFLPTQSNATEAQAKALYQRAIVIDALARPNFMNVPWPPEGPLTPQQVENARTSGITAVNATVSGSDFEKSVRRISMFYAEVDKHPTVFMLIRKHSDIARAKSANCLGIILGFQEADMIGRDLSRLDVFQELGVRIFQLTYNDRNLLGDGSLESGDAGLSALGNDAVRRLNALGIAVDLSHCGTRTTADGIAVSAKPVLITHSGCREVYRHPRNKEDRELKALADKGGVIGIYLMPFLGGAPGAPTVDLLIRHIEHAIRVCGIEHVGIGSDLSITPVEETPEYTRLQNATTDARKAAGISAPDEDRKLYIPELNHPRRLESIAIALAKRGHPSATIEKIIGGNFHRVLGEIWK